MNAVGLLTADKVKTRAASAAKTAFEAWQVRIRLSSVSENLLSAHTAGWMRRGRLSNGLNNVGQVAVWQRAIAARPASVAWHVAPQVEVHT